MRCPVCKAELQEGPDCRRCRADLSLLFSLQDQRDRAIQSAYQFINEGRLNRALALAEGVDALQHDEISTRLLAVIHLLRRDFHSAWRCYVARGGTDRGRSNPDW
jgi:hypothetical protein